MVLIVLSPHLPASLPAGPGFAASHHLRWREDGFRPLRDNQALWHKIVAQIGWNSVSAAIDVPLRPEFRGGGERQIILNVGLQQRDFEGADHGSRTRQRRYR